MPSPSKDQICHTHPIEQRTPPAVVQGAASDSSWSCNKLDQSEFELKVVLSCAYPLRRQTRRPRSLASNPLCGSKVPGFSRPPFLIYRRPGARCSIACLLSRQLLKRGRGSRVCVCGDVCRSESRAMQTGFVIICNQCDRERWG
jgi:hypothetical protein